MQRTVISPALLLAVAVALLLTACSSSDGEEGRAEGGPAPAASEGDSNGAAEPDVLEPGAGDEGTDDDEDPDEAVRDPSPPDQHPTPDRDHPHLHGAWVHLFDDTLKSEAGIRATVDELADAGATAVFAQIVRRHDAYYDSDVLPRTVDPDLPADLDVLGALIDAAHSRGLQMHAWISVAPTWHDTYAELPRPTGWIAAEHGHLAAEADRWVTRSVDGVWSQYLDPALPEVRAHTVAAVRELVERYPVDGIHLDYVRYESERHGYHPRAVQAYRDETGTSGTPAPDDARWSQWRRDRTRQLVAEVAAAIDEQAPHVLLSAAVISWGPGPGHADAPTFADTRTMTEALQDWESWARDGLLDAVMPMHYFREHDDAQRSWFASWLAFDQALAAETDTLVVPGVGGWLNAPAATVSQAVAARGVADGVLVYSYQQPTDDHSRSVWQRLRELDWGAPG